MNESLEGGAVFPGAIQAAVDKIHANQAEIDQNQAMHDDVTARRQAAIDAAAKPHDGRLAHYNKVLKELKGTDLEATVRTALRGYREGLTSIDDAALGVFIAESGDSLTEFCYDIVKTATEELEHQTRAERTLGAFSIFQAFSQELTNALEPVPVGLVRVSWFEEVAMQAAFEGKDDSTGIFSKIVRAELGTVTAESLKIISEPKIDGAFEYETPTEVQLIIQNPRVLSETYDFGAVNGAKCEDKSQPISIVLARKAAEDDHHRLHHHPVIDWELSNSRDFSQIRHDYRSANYLLYGQALLQGLDELIADEEVDRAIKPTLQQERDRLTS